MFCCSLNRPGILSRWAPNTSQFFVTLTFVTVQALQWTICTHSSSFIVLVLSSRLLYSVLLCSLLLFFPQDSLLARCCCCYCCCHYLLLLSLSLLHPVTKRFYLATRLVLKMAYRAPNRHRYGLNVSPGRVIGRKSSWSWIGQTWSDEWSGLENET